MSNNTKRSNSKKKRKDKIISHEFFLSPEDRLTYIYKRNPQNITEVVNVSYEILLDDRWITIIHYDSYHGYLHVHNRIDLDDEKETVTTLDVPGSHDYWLNWSIEDIKDNYERYKTEFLKRIT